MPHFRAPQVPTCLCFPRHPPTFTPGTKDMGWFCTSAMALNSYFSLLLLLSHFSCVLLCATHRWPPTRLPRPWDSPGKNTGVGCHFLLQCMKLKSESKVTQSSPTLGDPMDCSPPGSSIHGIFQARVLEWVAIAFSDKLGNYNVKIYSEGQSLANKI